MLKFCVLFLNYKCPNQCVFCCSYGLICDFLEFPSVKPSKIVTAHRTQRDTNFKPEKSMVCKGSFFDFFKFMSFTAAKILVLQISLENELRIKYLLTVCQILRNFTEGNSRKFTLSFAFYAHVDVMKYRKTLTFPFERVQIT